MVQRSRMELHKILCDVLGSDNVYYQRPSSVKMKYPCILYSLSYINFVYADDRPYVDSKRYDVTLMDRDPDSEIADKLKELPMCSFDRFYAINGLNHTVYRLYF